MLAALAVLAVLLWIRQKPAMVVAERRPGTDRYYSRSMQLGKSVGLTRGKLEKGEGLPADLPGAWPCFRGPNRDAVSTETVALARSWGPSGPPVLWQISLGDGYASAAVLMGRVYVLDHQTNITSDVLRCLSLADGKEIWRYSYTVRVVPDHGVSRTVPAVTDQHVVTLGPKCHVTCLNSVTGDFRWAKDLVAEYGTQTPKWYAGQCPLIEGDRAILAPAGTSVLMMAVDCRTGDVLWRTSNPRKWTMTHCSILPMDFKSRRMYVYPGSGGVAGVSAADGSILWDTTEWKVNVTAVASPVDCGGGRIFLSGGYDAGCIMIQVREQAGALKPELLWRLPAAEFGAPLQTPVFHNGRIYGVRPDQQLACLDLRGKILWTSGRQVRFGDQYEGNYMAAGSILYVMNGSYKNSGTLVMVDLGAGGYQELARARVLKGLEAWGPMALAGGRLIVRDLKTMACLDVSAK